MSSCQLRTGASGVFVDDLDAYQTFPMTGLRSPNTRPLPEDLGWSPLTWVLLAMQGITVLVTVGMFWWSGLEIDWTDNGGSIAAVVVVGAASACFFWQPGNPREWLFAEAAASLTLLFLLAQSCPIAQYAALALKFPSDRPLAGLGRRACPSHLRYRTASNGSGPARRSDEFFGPPLFSLLYQFLLPCVILPALRDRDALWEYVFVFHVSSFCTLAALALVPAGCAFTYYNFEALYRPAALSRPLQRDS